MKNKVFYNFVINEDLWYAIGYYNRYGLHNKYDNTIVDISLEEVKKLADDTIKWIESQIKNVYVIDPEEGAPEEWVTLYYMTLSYMYDYYDECPIKKKLSESNLEELKDACHKTVDWLKKLASDIRETTDNDLKYI